MFNFIKNRKSERNLIYVLDRLLQISTGYISEELIERRSIDIGLYKILNRPEVNQEIIHLGSLPIVRENKNATHEFMQFVDNLAVYMEYDIHTDFVWTQTIDNPIMQKQILDKVTTARNQVLQYVHDKQLISDSQYKELLDYKIKTLA